MSLGGRLKYKSKVKGSKGRTTATFRVEGKLDRADWEVLYRKLKETLARAGVTIVRVRETPKK